MSRFPKIVSVSRYGASLKMTVGVMVVVAVTEMIGVRATVCVIVEGFGSNVVVVTQVVVLTGIEMNELQNEMAEDLYWLRTLTIDVTSLHLFESAAADEAQSNKQLSARRIEMMMDGIITNYSKR